MDAFIERLRNEPVLVTQIVTAVLGLLVCFGLALPAATTATIMSVAQLVAGLIARSKVTPTRNVPDETDSALGVAS